MIIPAMPFSGHRLRARRVDEEAFALSISEESKEMDDWLVDVEHGGGVANSYGYPADTECVLVVSDPFGIAVYWTARTRANGITDRGAADACIGGAGDLFDIRISNKGRKAKALEQLKVAHRQKVPAMTVIAVAASIPSDH